MLEANRNQGTFTARPQVVTTKFDKIREHYRTSRDGGACPPLIVLGRFSTCEHFYLPRNGRFLQALFDDLVATKMSVHFDAKDTMNGSSIYHLLNFFSQRR
jgi:hypothetical protein